MAHYTNKIFKCPYYTSNSKGLIRCQGGNITMCNDSELRKYYIEYCASDRWDKCSMAKALNKFYAEAKSYDLRRKRIVIGGYKKK